MPAPAPQHTHKIKARRRRKRRFPKSQRRPDLHVGEVDAVEVAQHLVDLRGVLQHGARRLGQVVQRRVSAQRLCKGTDSSDLRGTHKRVF